MRRVIYLSALGSVIVAAVIVTAAGAQVYPTPWNSSRRQPPPAPVPKSGETTSEAVGDDGDLQRGVAWPDPRFIDNGDGTVTDNLTGLIWLQDATCFNAVTWQEALDAVRLFGLGGTACENYPAQVDPGWRLPNVKELTSLVDYGQQAPLSLPDGHPFVNTFTSFYWTSTSWAPTSRSAWIVYFMGGYVFTSRKYNQLLIWPVRDAD